MIVGQRVRTTSQPSSVRRNQQRVQFCRDARLHLLVSAFLRPVVLSISRRPHRHSAPLLPSPLATAPPHRACLFVATGVSNCLLFRGIKDTPIDKRGPVSDDETGGVATGICDVEHRRSHSPKSHYHFAACIDANMEDPFVSDSPAGAQPQRESHRYSTFDPQSLSLDASSPSQIKRALEAHLSETERRLQEASNLGTSLVNQQKELSDKLKEVEDQQDEGEVGPELRQKLADLEKEFNEIGRESARASLGPKSRQLASEDTTGQSTPGALDGRVSGSTSLRMLLATLVVFGNC